MTQETLSHLSGVTQGHLSEIEAAKRNVSIDRMGVLARALDVPVGELLTEQRVWSPADGQSSG